MDGPGLAEQEQAPELEEGRPSARNNELWCPPVGAWDFPMSHSEKVRRLLLVFGAEAETSERESLVLQQERDKWRARAKVAEAVLEPLTGSVAEEQRVAAEALDRVVEAAEAAKAVLNTDTHGEMSMRPPALSRCTSSEVLANARSPQHSSPSRMRMASLRSPQQSSPSRLRMASQRSPHHSSPSRMRMASLRSPHQGSPPKRLPSNLCSPQHSSSPARLTAQQLQWPPPCTSLAPDSP